MCNQCATRPKTELEKLRELAQTLVSLCPSKEGLGGRAPIGAFMVLSHRARKILADHAKD